MEPYKIICAYADWFRGKPRIASSFELPSTSLTPLLLTYPLFYLYRRWRPLLAVCGQQLLSETPHPCSRRDASLQPDQTPPRRQQCNPLNLAYDPLLLSPTNSMPVPPSPTFSQPHHQTMTPSLSIQPKPTPSRPRSWGPRANRNKSPACLRGSKPPFPTPTPTRRSNPTCAG